MLAKHQSTCYVCMRQVKVGQDISHVPGIGWCHTPCTVGLDDPLPPLSDFEMLLYGPSIKTKRQLADARLQLDAVDDAEPGDPFDLEDFGGTW